MVFSIHKLTLVTQVDDGSDPALLSTGLFDGLITVVSGVFLELIRTTAPMIPSLLPGSTGARRQP